MLATILVVTLVFCSCGKPEETSTPPASETTTPPATTPPAAPTATAVEIPWNSACDYEGCMARVTGPVVAVEDMGPGVPKILVTLGDKDKGCIAAISYDDKDKFTNPAIEDFMGKEVAVTGEVTINQWNQMAEIAVTDPSQLVIQTAVTSSVEITWEEVKDHVGETATVTGPVIKVLDLGQGIGKIVLDVGDEEKGPSIIVAYDYKDKFTDPAIEEYNGKEVAVTGKIGVNAWNQKPEINITDPSQIVIK